MGLMDRLSSYAAREAESVDDETRRRKEEESVSNLLQKLELSNETENHREEDGKPAEGHENGTAKISKDDAESVEKSDATNQASEANVGIPGDVKLYDIFYDQVVNLVKTRGLPIQDIMALLVSLVKLALYDTRPPFLSFFFF